MLEGKRYLLKNQIRFTPSETSVEKQHWVSVRAPVQSRLPIERNSSFEYEEVSVEFVCGTTGVLSEIVVTRKTDAKSVPKIIPKTGFDNQFDIEEPPDNNRSKPIDALCRLEGFLGPFGLTNFDFRRLEWTWFVKDSLDQRKLIVQIKMGFTENRISRPALSADELKSLSIQALEGENRALLTLSLFRAGEDSFQNYRYQDALRYFLLTLEHEFGDGKFKSSGVTKSFGKQERLIRSIGQAEKHTLYFNRAGDIRKETIQAVLREKSSSEVIDWLVNLRGYLFHQSLKRQTNWHPSLNIPHKEEAILVRSILKTTIEELVQNE